MLLLECDPDPSTWLPVPDAWDGPWAGPDEWAGEAVGAFGTADAPPPDDVARHLVTALTSIALSRAAGGAVDRSYVFLPEAHVPPVVLDVAILPAEGPAAERHRYLGRADVGGVGTVQVSEVTSEHLGVGTAVLRFDEVGGDPLPRIVGVWRALWRVGEHDVAVSVSAPTPDALLAALPSATALVLTMRSAVV